MPEPLLPGCRSLFPTSLPAPVHDDFWLNRPVTGFQPKYAKQPHAK
jgi:hypothetical protein